MKQLLSEVINEIKPSKEYENEILNKANNIINIINKSIKEEKAAIGGSGAKGTWLKLSMQIYLSNSTTINSRTKAISCQIFWKNS